MKPAPPVTRIFTTATAGGCESTAFLAKETLATTGRSENSSRRLGLQQPSDVSEARHDPDIAVTAPRRGRGIEEHDGADARGARGDAVAVLVADRPGRGEIEAVIGSGLEKHPA